MKKSKLNVMDLGQLLTRTEMKKIMAGSGGGGSCGSYCFGCSLADGGSGCMKWTCVDGMWCTPVWSNCCWA
ncbi:MAG: hypothetical protein ACFCU6_06860 [Balneolaceae bacterium]